ECVCVCVKHSLSGGFEASQPQLLEFFQQRMHSHIVDPLNLSVRAPPSPSRTLRGSSLLRWFCELEVPLKKKLSSSSLLFSSSLPFLLLCCLRALPLARPQRRLSYAGS